MFVSLLVAFAAIVAPRGPCRGAGHDHERCARGCRQTADQINADLVKLRQRDRTAARSLQAELADLDDEMTYLKVKLRKERNVPRADYMDVRDRLENLRSRVNGNDNYTGRYSSGSRTSTIADESRSDTRHRRRSRRDRARCAARAAAEL